MKVATGLDLPLGHPGSAWTLVGDLYHNELTRAFDATIYTLPHAHPAHAFADGIRPLPVSGQPSYDGPGYRVWVQILAACLADDLKGRENEIDVVHCQTLTFGMTPALIKALPDHPKIALVHGADLRAAQSNATQLEALRRAAAAVDEIVVPSGAFGARLIQLAPDVPREKISQISWGVPDHLAAFPSPHIRRAERPLRLLYCGRTGPETGAGELIAACRSLRNGASVTLIGPAPAYRALRALGAATATYLGDLPRPRLWETYNEFDALVVGAAADSFPRSALEAQACGLPVMFHDTAALRDLFSASGLPINLHDPAAIRTAIEKVDMDRSILHGLRTIGYANIRRRRLSVSINALAALSERAAARDAVPSARARRRERVNV